MFIRSTALSPHLANVAARTDQAVSDSVLGDQGRGFSGVITGLDFGPSGQAGGLSSLELERRLLEIGFVEGARVEILHEGFIGRDPIAVKLDDMRVALRRREARCVRVRAEEGG